MYLFKNLQWHTGSNASKKGNLRWKLLYLLKVGSEYRASREVKHSSEFVGLGHR